MSFDYEQAKRIVKEAVKHPNLRVKAFVPICHPKLTEAECAQLQTETGVDLSEIRECFFREDAR